MMFDTVAIVGVGLIGGSVGLGLKRRGLARRVVGVGRNEATLNEAKTLGAIDAGFTEMKAGLAEADLAVLCTPVNTLAGTAITALALAKPGCIVTDAGSTKGFIKVVDHLDPNGRVRFVGSHPIAGSEKRGAAFGDADLFVNRLAVVTPSRHSDEDALKKVEAFWQSLGSRTVRLDINEHDRLLGWSSHLPHLAAAAVAGCLPDEARPFTGTGFRDATRIAAGDPDVWVPILMHNAGTLRPALDTLIERLNGFRAALEDPDRLRQLLLEGKQVRDAVGS